MIRKEKATKTRMSQVHDMNGVAEKGKTPFKNRPEGASNTYRMIPSFRPTRKPYSDKCLKCKHNQKDGLLRAAISCIRSAVYILSLDQNMEKSQYTFEHLNVCLSELTNFQDGLEHPRLPADLL